MSRDEKHPLNKSDTFKEICYLTIEDTIPFYMYRSVNTGITVCIAELDSPIISGYFNIVTETLDDDGLPYALSHLIFAGSKEYPYNGILNRWADRCLGSNINAYCLKDRTYFTMNAAGSEGFLSLMPKYLEHILDPALKDSAYLTEIHNITGKGKHTGVVYCERQEKEHTLNEIMNKKMFRALYPGQCGYKSVIEGTTKNLRESTNNEKVKQFHEKFYRSDNLTVLIIGKVKHCDIFQALLPLEEKIMLKKKKDIFKRPWQSPIKQLKKSVEVNVEFPFSDEHCGEVYVAWRGPSATQIYDYCGCTLLLVYLMESSNSPLILELVKRKIYKSNEEINPIFNIKCFFFVHSVLILNMCFTKVPIETINLIKESIDTVLSNLCTDGINIEAIRSLIQRLILAQQTLLENNPHEIIVSLVFDHIVYGNTTDDLKQRLNSICDLENLKNKPDTYFLDLFKKYFVNAPMVVVKGKPSLDEYFKLQEEKKEYIESEQIAKKSIPIEILASVPIPNIDSIPFYHITRYSTETFKQHHKLDVKKLPFFTYLNDINTNFFYLHVIMDTSSIEKEYSMYIALLLQYIEVSPEKRADVIKYNTQIGISHRIESSHRVSLMLQVELQDYEKSVQLFKELLYNTEITIEKLKTTIVRYTNSLVQQIAQETIFLRSSMVMLLYKSDSHSFTYNMYQQYFSLKDIEERLNTDAGQKEVLKGIESVRKTLTSSKNIFVYMAVNVDKLTERFSDVYAPWNKFFSDFMKSEKTRPNVIAEWKLLNSFNNLLFNGHILKLEIPPKSSSLHQTCQCINDFQDPDLPALIVCLKYFAQEEGPIWKELKKKKFSCKFKLYATPGSGLLHLQLLKATNIVAAYKKTKSIVETHITEIKWDQHLYDSAKSSAILMYVNEVKSISHRIEVTLESYCKNVPHDYNYQMMQRISAVTMDDMSRVAASYFKPFFDPKNVKTVIICNTSEGVEIQKAFEGMKYNLILTDPDVIKCAKQIKDLLIC